MKTIALIRLILPALLIFIFNAIQAQDAGTDIDDNAAIRQAAMDYIDGYYSGDAARVERAIHPDLNKATPRDLPQTGRTVLNYTTWSALIEYTRAKAGILEDTARHISINILATENDVANVKVTSSQFTDYLQLAHIDGQWKIINVLFTSGLRTPPRLKDFDPENEKPDIEKASLAYLNALGACDAGRLSLVLDQEFNKITLQPVAQTGKTTIRRQRYDGIIEAALAGIGKQDEVYRNNRVVVLDVYDGLAVVRCESTGTVEFIQMYKGNGQWKLFNSIARPNNKLTLQQAMTVIAGDPMIDFSLPVYGGGTFALSDYRGKNILLVFPRGWTGNNWCAYCPYQYLELEKLEKESGIKAKYNLEIAYVMPYSSDRIHDWMEKFPDALQVVEGIKNPPNPPAAGTIQLDYTEWVKKNFPLVFEVKKDDPHILIPVLADEDKYLSRLLKISTNFWDWVSADQNIASVFIIDRKGILRFKYIGQMTEDRPSVDFLLGFIKSMK